MNIDTLAQDHWNWVETKNWHNKTVLEEMALIGSEVGEATNECRGKVPTPEFSLELADIILRTLDTMLNNGIQPSTAIRAKIALNSSRDFSGKLK